MVQLQLASADGPVRPGARQIYEALRDQIAAGVYAAGDQLPSSRALAEELGVSRTTVTAAYEQLSAEGFIEVRQGARPRVAALGRPEPRPIRAMRRKRPIRLSHYGERLRAVPLWRDYEPDRPPVDFRYGDLAPRDFPITAWRRAMNMAMLQRPDRVAYDDPRGSIRLRTALQGYLWRARTLQCDLGQIIIVNGSQQGLDLCARLLLDAGDRFVIEDPCYVMARQIFASTGADTVPIRVDEDGLDTRRLAGVEARLAYVTPSHQFPMGGVMPVSRRRELIAWARRHDSWIVEDDYDSEYRYDINPVPPLHGLDDSDGVIYLGTISKTLSPTLRIGYLVVPHDLQELFATAKQLIDRHSPVTEQEALATLLENGAYESHVRRVRRLNGERRQTLLNALHRQFGGRVEIEGADAGLHIVVWFKGLAASAEDRLIEAAGGLGLGLHSLSRLYEPSGDEGERRDEAGIIMGYGALEPAMIERGVGLLGEALALLR